MPVDSEPGPGCRCGIQGCCPKACSWCRPMPTRHCCCRPPAQRHLWTHNHRTKRHSRVPHLTLYRRKTGPLLTPLQLLWTLQSRRQPPARTPPQQRTSLSDNLLLFRIGHPPPAVGCRGMLSSGAPVTTLIQFQPELAVVLASALSWWTRPMYSLCSRLRIPPGAAITFLPPLVPPNTP